MQTAEKLKIFLVDDDPFHLHVMERMLRNLGYDGCVLFEDGVECLRAIHEKPDVIFLDHCMKNYTGYEILRKVKRYDPDVFVVMVSAQQDMQTCIDSLKYGAFDYIQKAGELSVQINKLMKKIESVREIMENQKPGFFNKLSKLF